VHKATLFNVGARTTAKEKVAKRTGGLTLFLIKRHDLKRGKIRAKRIEDISMRSLGSNEVFVHDVYVPKGNVLGVVDRG
jgi:acyl-CoA dehydrogenase